MRLFILGLLIASAAINAQAQQRAPYKEARAIYDQIGKTLGRIMLWEKKTAQDRRQAVSDATALRDKAAKLMGPMSQCADAANFHLNLIADMNAIVSAGQSVGNIKTFQLLGMLRVAEVLGERKAACYDEVEALDQQATKP